MQSPQVTIVGAGLTGLTLAYYLHKSGVKVLVLEKAPRVGGVIRTHQENGFLFESGPNTGVIGNVETVQLFKDLEPKVELITARPEAKNRWIYKKGWQPLPSGVMSAIKTPLFTVKDKFRILGEPFRKKGTDPHETLADLVRRRMGNSFLDYAIDPFISGVYSGDPEKLIPKYALPKLYQLEQNYGSFIKGAIAKAREPKTELEKQANKEVFSVKGGLAKLTDTLAEEIGLDKIALSCQNITVQSTENGFETTYVDHDGQAQKSASLYVVTCVSGEGVSETLPFISQQDRQALTDLNYGKIVQAVIGFNQWEGRELNAFGGLVPSKENKKILGVLFPSSIFENRAPQGGALLSIFMGGVKRPELFDYSDDEIKQIVMAELKDSLGCDSQPDLFKIFRYPKAIPQYEISSKLRFETIDKLQGQHKGLIIGGNIRDGIGMADRIKQGRALAEEIVKSLN